jgi:hypothetical protein
VIRKEAGLAFWLDWVEHRGGLWEDAGDTALALLPAGLASELELSEETAVTADPDVAREDGALLLVTGHPVVVKAAESVLAAGDTGTLTLAAPRSVPPDAATLLSKAREYLPVDHGRLDPRADATPERALRPVLRVGALVGYELSADDHFQEQAPSKTRCAVNSHNTPRALRYSAKNAQAGREYRLCLPVRSTDGSWTRLTTHAISPGRTRSSARSWPMSARVSRSSLSSRHPFSAFGRGHGVPAGLSSTGKPYA